MDTNPIQFFLSGAQRWRNAGVSVTEAQRWKKAGFILPGDPSWKKAGFSLPEAQLWRNAGFSFTEAQPLKEAGLTPSAIKQVCPKGMAKLPQLLGNPYLLNNYCMNLQGEPVAIFQMINRNSALVNVLSSSLTVYLNTGRKSLKTNWMGLVSIGIVKFVGVYKYRTVMGALMIVPSMEPVVIEPIR